MKDDQVKCEECGRTSLTDICDDCSDNQIHNGVPGEDIKFRSLFGDDVYPISLELE